MASPESSARGLRLLVVDDHPTVRTGVLALIRGMPAMEGGPPGHSLFSRVDVAASLAEALEHLELSGEYDLAVFDLELEDTGGRESLAAMRERYPDMPMLVFSAHDSLESVEMAFEYGARAFVPKRSQEIELTSAIRLVLSGSTYIPPSAASLLGFPPPRPGKARNALPTRLQFSPREEQVFRLLLKGLPNKVIGSKLDMAEGTVKSHLNAIYRVLGVNKRVEAVLRAQQLGLH